MEFLLKFLLEKNIYLDTKISGCSYSLVCIGVCSVELTRVARMKVAVRRDPRLP